MTRHHRRCGRVALLAASGPLLVASVVGAPAGHAATLDDSGWWERNQGLTLSAPTRPQAGDLRIALDPAGVSAVAAVRYRLLATESRPLLTLRISSGPAAQVASVVACPTTRLDWKGAQGGPIAEAPAADCGTKVSGLFSGDRTRLSFDLTPLLREGVVSVLFTPVATATDPVTATFSIDVAKPTAGDLATSEATTTTMFASASAASLDGPPSDGGGAGGSPAPEAAAPFSPVPTVEAPSFVPSEPTTSPSTAVGPITPAFAPGRETAAARPQPTVPAGSGRTAALLAVAALLGAAVWLYLKEPTEMVTGPTPGGLGKFVRERAAAAPPVS